MNCRDFTRELEALRDRGPDASSAAFTEHAQACAPCARLLREERDLRAGLDALRRAARETPIPASFAREVQRAARERAAPARFSRPSWPVAAGFAAAAGLLAAALLVLGPQPVEPPRASLPSAAAPRSDSGFSPVVYSDRGVDILGADPSAASSPVEGPAAGTQQREQVAVLVEWNL